MKTKILVVGASGVNGYAVTEYFKNKVDYEVITLSREKLYYDQDHQRHVKIDLLQNKKYDEYADQLSGVSHIFYAALKPSDDPLKEANENEDMLRNCINIVREHSDDLRHITFLQGGKIYGAHLGIYKTPATEDQTRHFPPNLYFRHEDYLRDLCNKSDITYTALRPDIIIGYSLYSAMNLGNLIGVYASICKETGMDFIFPGSPNAYNVLVNVTDSDIVAEAVEWSFTSGSETKDQAFNITNGDIFRWKDIWQDIAEFYDIKLGYAQPIGIQKHFDSNENRWSNMVKKYNLKDYKISTIAKGNFGDFIFNIAHDAIFDVNKARRHGFHKMNKKSSESIIKHLKYLQAKNIIPEF